MSVWSSALTVLGSKHLGTSVTHSISGKISGLNKTEKIVNHSVRVWCVAGNFAVMNKWMNVYLYCRQKSGLQQYVTDTILYNTVHGYNGHKISVKMLLMIAAWNTG